MEKPEVNRLITDKVDEIDEKDQRQFIKDVLQFERDNLDQPMPRYTEEFKEKVDDYVSEDQ